MSSASQFPIKFVKKGNFKFLDKYHVFVFNAKALSATWEAVILKFFCVPKVD